MLFVFILFSSLSINFHEPFPALCAQTGIENMLISAYLFVVCIVNQNEIF